MLYVKFSIIVLVLLCLLGCKNSKNYEPVIVDFKPVTDNFSDNTLYLSIHFQADELSVNILKDKNSDVLSEWEYKGEGEWASNKTYKLETDGETSKEDYLFLLTPDIQEFSLQKVDSINKQNTVLKSSLFSPFTFYEKKMVNLSITYLQNDKKKTSEFTYFPNE